jgi:hypothetical protein
LAKLSDVLDVSPDELKQYDTRGPIADLKRLMDSDPKLGFAFRGVVEKVKNGELTAEDIIVKLSKRKSRAYWAAVRILNKIRAQYGIRNQEPAETNGGHLQAASPGKIPRSAGG